MKPIDNKYTKWYNQLIISREDRILTEYCETHHIIPRSIGGTDAIDNLIKLTPREHFIAHLLLTKMYPFPYNHKMFFAFSMMLVDANNTRYTPTSRLYEMARRLVGIAVSKANKGKIPWNKGIPRTQEVKDAVSKANKGKTPWNRDCERTDTDRQKMREGWKKLKETGFVPHNKGKVESSIKCIYCDRDIAGMGNFNRWHGNNCKMKNKNEI